MSVKTKVSEIRTSGSKAERALASHILNAMESIPFETAASLGKRVGVSEATVGRFCRSMGYKSFKDLKEKLKDDFGDLPWLVSDRLRDLNRSNRESIQNLNAGMELEIAALVRIYEYARTSEWQDAVTRLATCDRVFIAGFQSERGLAQYFANQLQFLRDRVVLMEHASGNYSELLASDSDACLVIFDARKYSRLSKGLAQQAYASGIPVTLVTDTFCDWGADTATEMFAIPTQFNQLWDSSAQMASFSNLLVNSVLAELGVAVEARMKRMVELYGKFIGHVDDPVGKLET